MFLQGIGGVGYPHGVWQYDSIIPTAEVYGIDYVWIRFIENVYNSLRIVYWWGLC